MYHLLNAVVLTGIQDPQQVARRGLGSVMESALAMRLCGYLALFFRDAAKMRDVLREYGIIISGSVALHFFTDDVTWRPSDMDLYVSERFFGWTIRHLCEEQGLELRSVYSGGYSGRSSAAGVIRIAKLASRKGSTVDVMCSMASAEYPIAYFWATHLFNMVTADYACCAYPGDVFGRRSRLVQGAGLRVRRDVCAVKAKYEARGYAFSEAVELGRVHWRVFGDRQCQTLRFARQGSSLSSSLREQLGPTPVLWTLHGTGGVEVVGNFDSVQNVVAVRVPTRMGDDRSNAGYSCSWRLLYSRCLSLGGVWGGCYVIWV